jgi:hypothetical protein
MSLHAFMLCLRFVWVEVYMPIGPSLVHLGMLRMRMTYIVPAPRHMPACIHRLWTTGDWYFWVANC